MSETRTSIMNSSLELRSRLGDNINHDDFQNLSKNENPRNFEELEFDFILCGPTDNGHCRLKHTDKLTDNIIIFL